MNILITGVGGPSPRSFALSIKKYGKPANYRLIATDANPLAAGLYNKSLFEKSFVIPKATDPGYWSVIENIIASERIDIAVVLPELEVLEWSSRAKAHELPCKVLLPEHDLVKVLVNKGKMTELLESAGIVPKSIVFRPESVPWSKLQELLGPAFWVRATVGTSGLGSLKVDSETSLKNWLSINPGVGEFIASEYLPGRNLACKLLWYKGKLLRAAVGERVNYIMAKVAPSGITGNTAFGRLLNEPAVVDTAIRAMESLFAQTATARHGFFTVDLREDKDGIPRVTEVNVRHVAFSQCFAAAGANFAEDTIQLLAGDPAFDQNYRMYQFEEGLIFLRDVDVEPILMREAELLKPLRP